MILTTNKFKIIIVNRITRIVFKDNTTKFTIHLCTMIDFFETTLKYGNY